MKNFLFVALLALCFGPFAQAQEANRDVSAEDYERMIESQMEMKMREFVIETLALTEQEITAFDPIFRDYLNQRADLADKRRRLIEEHADEMKEDQPTDAAQDETADFIENYWEVAINESELRKDFFDRLEDQIPVRKAVQFFLLEEMVQNRMNQQMLLQIVPIDTTVYHQFMTLNKQQMQEWKNKQNGAQGMQNNQNRQENQMTQGNQNQSAQDTQRNQTARTDDMQSRGVTMQGKNAVMAYSQWVKKPGNMSLEHTYIHGGITKLLDAVSAVAMAGDKEMADFAGKKQQIMTQADKLRENPLTDKHADIARNVFIQIADLVQRVQQNETTYTDAQTPVRELANAARQIEANKLLTTQEQAVKAYFDQADKALTAMSDKTKWDNTDKKE